MKIILIENSNLGSFFEKIEVKRGFYLNFLIKNYKSIIFNKNLNINFFKKIKFYNIIINKFLKIFYKNFLEKFIIIKFYKNLSKKDFIKIFRKFGINYNYKYFKIIYNFKFKYKIFSIELINENNIKIYVKLFLII